MAVIEKVKAVNNPLTIIAIFAALAEIAGTVALAAVDKEIQHIFVWFVMGFPLLLVLLFFITLNFNPTVLYAPSDFRNEENFLNTLIGTQNVSISLEEVTTQLEEAKDKILSQTIEQISAAGEAEKSKISDILDRQLSKIEDRISSIRHEADIAYQGIARLPRDSKSPSVGFRVVKELRKSAQTEEPNTELRGSYTRHSVVSEETKST
jgi:hypothetical protein